MRVIVTLAIETGAPFANAHKQEFGKLVANCVQQKLRISAKAIHVAPVVAKKSYHTRRKERNQARRAA